VPFSRQARRTTGAELKVNHVFDAFFGSLGSVLEPGTLLLLLAGVAVGFVVGILPGLGGPVTLALMLPFTFHMEPIEAFAFLLGMLVVTSTTGDLTSVLFGIPGEATTAAAALDGYPMTKRGESGRALGAVLFSSLLGSIFGAAVLAAAVPFIRPVVLALGPPEFFVLTLVGLTFVITLSGAQVLKGFLMATAGLLVAVIGVDSQAGIPRYTFDELYLWDGINLIPLVIGLFGGAELLQLMLSRKAIAGDRPEGPDAVTGVGQGVRDTLRHWKVVIRSSSIGVLVGMIPGLGGSVAQFIAYGQAKQSSKNPELFGKGAIDGLIASGANNNARDSGSLIPTIAFGIPGGANTAVLLSAFLIVGLNPGPEMLTVNVDVTFSMVWITVIANAIAVAVAFTVLKPLRRLTFISGPLLVPFLLMLMALGAYSASNSWGDIFVMLAAAAIGVACIRWNWPRIPFLLAVVLGGLAERYLFLSHSLFAWDWLTRPAVLGLFALTGLILLTPLLRRVRAGRRARSRKDDDSEVMVP
jgi:putative tricarboxylic transport membrane protein